MGILPIGADILPASDDRVFKLLMTAPEAGPGLIKLISSIIGRNVTDVVVDKNELPATDTEEKSERFDVNCKIDDGSQINIEMQASRMQEDAGGGHRNIKGKSIYYLCDLHRSQPSKGVRRYDRLVRTYQITFCSYTVFPKRTEFVNPFSMRHDITNDLLTDAISIIFVELSKLGDIVNKPVDDMTVLEKWSVFFEYADNPAYREAVNKIIESEEVLQMATNLLMSISKDEHERAVFRSRKKFQTDYESDMATAKDNGRAEGEAAKAFDIARSAIGMNMPDDVIMKLTGLTAKEIKSLH